LYALQATSPGQPQDATARTSARAQEDPATVGIRSFVEQAAQGGHAEVSLGKLATERASHADVKRFAQMMVQDHGKANEELAVLGRQKGWTVPMQPMPRHKAEEQRLGRLSGAAFDKAYMDAMVKDHEKDVRLFEQASRQLDDPELKRWAEQKLPTLRAHLDEARGIAARVSDGKKPGAGR
jgi:putative membrane protein